MQVEHDGIGGVVINYLGAINASAGDGIDALTTTGALTITNGAITAVGGVGVSGFASTGNIIANVNGNITSTDQGLLFDTAGTKTIVVGTGVTVNSTGGSDIEVTGAGATSITNNGTIGASTTGMAILATNFTDGAVTINNATGATLNGALSLTSDNDTLNNSGVYNVGTTIATNLLGGNDAINNNANGVINLSALIDFGSGSDSLTNTGLATINLVANANLVNLETFTQSGRINLNTNTLTLSGTAFTNAGTIDTSGSAAIANVTSFNNSGTLDLAPGTFTVPLVAFTNSGTILADEGASTINGQASFANTGTIDLQDGVTGDVLTINSSYVGSGGSNLLVDFDDTTADRLIVGAASGTTSVNATYVGLGLLNVPGILVVDTASTTANAFVLGTVGGNTSPLVDYSLLQIGSDFFLSAAPDPSAFDPVAISNMAGSLWYQTADEVTAQTDLPSVSDGFGFWGQIYYSQDKMGDDDEVAFIDGTAFAVDNELKTDRYGIQAGIDYGFGGARIGLTGGYGVAKADNDLNSELKAKGWNIGLYGAFGGLTGFHGSALIKHDRYDLEFESGAFEGAEADLRSTGVDGSLGYRFGLGGDATLDAKIGLAHVKTKIDDITAFGFNYDIGTVTSTRGRAGVRAAFGGSLSPYIEAMVLREFKGDGDIELFDGATFYDIESDGKGTWFRLEAGLAPQLGSGPILAAWADLGDKKGFGLRAGFRFGGRAVEEVLPPPPPPMVEPAPPPPPPATQTCSDGSVILATDACPPPPPPPPPAPEPERG